MVCLFFAKKKLTHFLDAIRALARIFLILEYLINTISDFSSSNFRFQYSDSQLSQFGIILRARSPVDAVNLAGKTPLHVACAWGQEQVVEAACMLGGILWAELGVMWAEFYVHKT